MNKFMLRQAQELQAKLAKAQQELAEMTVEGTSGGGAVKVKVTGEMEIKEVSIDSSLLEAKDAEMLQDLVRAAVNEAIRQAKETAARKLSGITGGLNLPGLT